MLASCTTLRNEVSKNISEDSETAAENIQILDRESYDKDKS